MWSGSIRSGWIRPESHLASPGFVKQGHFRRLPWHRMMPGQCHHARGRIDARSDRHRRQHHPRLGLEVAGAVVINASHGGVYAAYLAAKLHAAAAIFNDAGVGRDRAGIGGLDYLQDIGIAAATVGHDSARIGDGADMMASGIVTHANGLAAALGVSPWPVLPRRCRRTAAGTAERSRATGSVGGRVPAHRRSATGLARRLRLARPAGAQGRDRRHRFAWRAARRQAGDRAQIRRARCPLQRRRDRQGRSRRFASAGARRSGIAAATVAAASARIGDARSTYEDGIVSRVNATAAAFGLRAGMSAREFVAVLRRALPHKEKP